MCDTIDGSPPGSSVPGILQARILEWAAISFSSACVLAKSPQSCLTLCDPMDSSPQAPLSTGFFRQEYWSGLPFPSPTLGLTSSRKPSVGDFMYIMSLGLKYQYLWQIIKSTVAVGME